MSNEELLAELKHQKRVMLGTSVFSLALVVGYTWFLFAYCIPEPVPDVHPLLPTIDSEGNVWRDGEIVPMPEPERSVLVDPE